MATPSPSQNDAVQSSEPVQSSVASIEARYRALFEDSIDAIVMTDMTTGEVLDVNPAACKMLGCPRDDIVGHDFTEYLAPQALEQLRELTDLSHHGGTEASEWLVRTHTGEVIPVLVSSRVMPDGQCQAFLRDMRQRRRIEAALRAAESTFTHEQQAQEREQRFLAEAGALLLKSGADYKQVLAEIAHAVVPELADWCAIHLFFGPDVMSRVKIVHRDPDLRGVCEALETYPMTAAYKPLTMQVVAERRTLVLDQVDTLDVASVIKDKTYQALVQAFHCTSCVVIPLLAREQVVGTFALGASDMQRTFSRRDVALFEKVASSLALAFDNGRLHEALERAIEARERMLGIVAHDLRNPLSTIGMNSAVIARQPDNAVVCERAATRIGIAIKRMDRLIQDLLDLTRLEGGQTLPISPGPTGPRALVTEACEQQNAAFGARQRQLKVELPEALPFVWADRARVGQVLDNLLANALKFSVEQVTVGARLAQGEVVFYVTNDGPLIAPGDIGHLFERFWQEKRNRPLGTGLGLYIVKEVVDVHGGRVWVESTPSQPTTFYFTLPLAEARGVDLALH